MLIGCLLLAFTSAFIVLLAKFIRALVAHHGRQELEFRIVDGISTSTFHGFRRVPTFPNTAKEEHAQSTDSARY